MAVIKEIVVDTIYDFDSLGNSQFDRVEICSALDLGGLTPDFHFVQHSSSLHDNVQVLIRPRQGDFFYSDIEKTNMEENIKVLANVGIKGVVFGALDENNEIDFPFTKKIATLCKNYGLEITFNRAFDFSNDFKRSIDILESLSFNRVLTAGCKTIFADGFEKFKKIVEYTNGRNIKIIAAGSIGLDDVKKIVSENIQVESIHFQVRKKVGESDFFGIKYDSNHEIINEISKLISV